jgi:isopentenyl diphosphate isomerase/L-lactate dehydrogenase-like FMN-dependent dehydrogenase
MQDVKKKAEKPLRKSPRALLNVEDYHQQAKVKLQKMIYDFYNDGSDDQLTLIDNQQAFRRIKLRPKILIDVSSHSTVNSISCQTKVLNSTTTISFPCIIAPSALHRLANSEHGELATVRAAVACSTIMCVSTGASIRMERIAEEHRQQIKTNYPQSTSQLWYQLYVYNNRQYSQRLIKRAERCGYKALILTVDACAVGNRECNIHNNFTLPDGIAAVNLVDDDDDSDFAITYGVPIDASLSWKDLDWIRSITSLPLILKGIIHPDDAREAVRHGVQGIVVSNHGGRQLDTCQSTIDALPDIMDAVRNEKHQIDVYVDGGVRRGTDILKAVALGAKAVLIGRAVLWGLTVDGEQGVKNVLDILKKEFRLAMMLCGCQTVDDIRKNDLIIMNNYHNRSKL